MPSSGGSRATKWWKIQKGNLCSCHRLMHTYTNSHSRCLAYLFAAAACHCSKNFNIAHIRNSLFVVCECVPFSLLPLLLLLLLSSACVRLLCVHFYYLFVFFSAVRFLLHSRAILSVAECFAVCYFTFLVLDCSSSVCVCARNCVCHVYHFCSLVLCVISLW